MQGIRICSIYFGLYMHVEKSAEKDYSYNKKQNDNSNIYLNIKKLKIRQIEIIKWYIVDLLCP